ncbi:MAG: hypothetical protein WC532_07570 [Candidatus Omnitrophota bacterium]
MRKTLEYFCDYCSKNKFLSPLFAAYYRLAVKSLALALKMHNFKQIVKVYLRHRDWILGVSDIDLIFIMKSLEPAEDASSFKKLWKTYIFLRKLFPMLCDTEEIRFIPEEQIREHPLRVNGETALLLSPHKWECIYSKKGSISPASFSLSHPEKPAIPHTRFLHFNFYGYMQRMILSGQDIPALKFCRLRKNMMKILQHLFYLKNSKAIGMDELTKQLSGQEKTCKDADEIAARDIFKLLEEVPAGAAARRNALLYAFRKLILFIQDVHDRHYDLGSGTHPAPHTHDGSWMGKPLKDFIEEGNRLFGERFRVNAIKPISELTQRAFLSIDENTDRDLFEKLILFSSRHYQMLLRSGTSLYVVTDKILTSQFYALWSPHALEAHILLARDSFNPGQMLKIKLPPEEWTLRKIRNSLAIFEEYYLPLLASPYAGGNGIDFCKIYERPEVEMLFHYFYYLKDRDVYFRDLKQAKGDSAEILCLTAAKYADEIGLNQWHPYEYVTAYPYLKKMIRLVDRMTCERIGRRC